MTSSSLQQSLIQSIQDSKNRSRNSSCILSETLQSDTSFHQLQPQHVNNHNEQWISFCQQLQSQFSHYFFEVQSHLVRLRELLHEKHIKEARVVTGYIAQLCEPMRKIVLKEQQYLYVAFTKQLELFQEHLARFNLRIGITDARVSISEFDQLGLNESAQTLQEVYSMFAMAHFFQQPVEQPSDDDIDVECTSISSDFSDEGREIEDFESETAQSLVGSIRSRLGDEDIYEACKKYHFTLQDGQLDLMEFFREILQFSQINEYEIMCFLYNSGLYVKTLRSKSSTIQDALRSFIANLQGVMNRIIHAEALGDHVDDCMQISKASFRSRKNLLRQHFYEVLHTKLRRWRELNLTTQDMIEQFNSEMTGSSDKRYLRKLSQRWSIPLNKFEIKVMAWDEGNNFVTPKTPKMVVPHLLQNPLEDMMQLFVEQDVAQTGFVEFRQFFHVMKQAAVPIIGKEAHRLFREHEIVRGSATTKGVMVKRVLDYQAFLWKMYGLPMGEPVKSPDASDAPTNRIINKYSQQQTNTLLIKSLTHKNRELLDKQRQLAQEQQVQLKRNEELQTQIAEMQQMSTDVNLKDQLEDIRRLKELENLENLQQNSNLNDVVLQKYRIKERTWMQERNAMLRQLELKDRQMEQYRNELESLIKEMRHIKTIRSE